MNFSKVQFGENTGLRGEERDELDFDKNANKRMKYYTTNYFTSDIKSQPGVNSYDGFGTPSQEINVGTALEHSIITNPRIKQDWRPLQLNYGSMAIAGPTITHTNERDRKSCNPRENEFYKRSFYTLDINPNATQKSSAFRQGVDSRNDSREEYN